MFEQSTLEHSAQELEFELESAAQELEVPPALSDDEWRVFETYEEKIRYLLNRRVRTKEEIQKRRQELAQVFSSIPARIAPRFFLMFTVPTRFRRRRPDLFNMANLFRRRLHSATQKQLLRILREKF
jgi:hypothetical protein